MREELEGRSAGELRHKALECGVEGHAVLDATKEQLLDLIASCHKHTQVGGGQGMAAV